MALIKCPECGKEISDKAVSCPGCGYPLVDTSVAKLLKDDVKVEDVKVGEKKVFCPLCGAANLSINKSCARCGGEIAHLVKNTSPYEDTNSIEGEVVIKCRLDKELHINNYNIDIIDYGKVIFSGEINSVKIVSVEEPETFSCGSMRFSFPKEKVGILFSNSFINLSFTDKKDFEIVSSLFKGQIAAYAKQQVEIQTRAYSTKATIQNKKDEKKLKNSLHCPKCKSTSLQYLGQETIGARPEKTKTSTTLNLNPLKPFTLFNQKEKVVKKAKSGMDFDRWRCEDCGKVFTTIKY